MVASFAAVTAAGIVTGSHGDATGSLTRQGSTARVGVPGRQRISSASLKRQRQHKKTHVLSGKTAVFTAGAGGRDRRQEPPCAVANVAPPTLVCEEEPAQWPRGKSHALARRSRRPPVRHKEPAEVLDGMAEVRAAVETGASTAWLVGGLASLLRTMASKGDEVRILASVTLGAPPPSPSLAPSLYA